MAGAAARLRAEARPTARWISRAARQKQSRLTMQRVLRRVCGVASFCGEQDGARGRIPVRSARRRGGTADAPAGGVSKTSGRAMTTPPRSLRSARRLALAACLLLGPAALAETTQTFSRGSLIIPQQASFQPGCGSVSAYGLVWRILQSNQAGGAQRATRSPSTGSSTATRSHPTGACPRTGTCRRPRTTAPGTTRAGTTAATSPSPNTDRGSRWCRWTTPLPFPASGVYPQGNMPNFATTSYTRARPPSRR